MNPKFRTQKWPATMGCITILAVILVGCAGNTGRITADPSVASFFKEPAVGSPYRFYFNGRENVPYAIIGIDTAYTFNSKYWTAVEPGAPQFKALVNRMFRTDGDAVTAGWIKGPDGRSVGIWYSPYRRTVVRVFPDNTVDVISPYTPIGRNGEDLDPL